MEIKNWQAFLAIAQRGSMHAAADAMHLSQPALSKRLSELERRIGLPLFDRIGRDLVINTHGQALLPEAETLIASTQSNGSTRGSTRQRSDWTLAHGLLAPHRTAPFAPHAQSL